MKAVRSSLRGAKRRQSVERRSAARSSGAERSARRSNPKTEIASPLSPASPVPRTRNDVTETLGKILRQNREALEKSFTPSQLEVLEKIAGVMAKALRAGRKLMLCGNGGSAADSQHIAAEFIGRFKRERRSLPAIALTTDTSILTALGNDYAYELIFSRQVEGLGERGDVLIGLSTSGNSKNVLEAVKAARARGLATVGFTGAGGGALKEVADLSFQAQSRETPHIQEVHITALHALSEVVEDLVLNPSS